MKNSTILFLAITTAAFLIQTGCRRDENSPDFRNAVNATGRTEILFDGAWKFFRGDAPGAQEAGFNDSSWRIVDLPHDWSIEDLPGKDCPGDSLALGGIDAGYMTGGTGWYRKSFDLPSGLKEKHFMLKFDGIYMNPEVWINGQSLGNHPYGYTSFTFDLTKFIRPGKSNVISVKVKNEGRNSRWYSGSGIYRHVWLDVISPVHLDPLGLVVTTVRSDSISAALKIRSSMINDSHLSAEVTEVTTVSDPSGKVVAQSETKEKIESLKEAVSVTDFSVEKPSLWSPDSPKLYVASVELFAEDKSGSRLLLDRIETRFGIRTVTLNADEGLKINGKGTVLRGGCMHHDNGPLGAAAFDRAEERRVELMKASGFNAIRCAHNPPSPAFLDACDKIGMLVIDETFDMWREGKNPDDYHKWFDEWWKKDVESMVFRDRNHPSIIFWSIGNEIPEKAKPEGIKLASEIAGYIRKIDSSRLITSAVNSVGPETDPYFAVLDACGYNYEKDKYAPDHRRLPSRVMFGTESFALEAFDYWMAVRDFRWVIGDFVWTGYDYLGESGIGWMGYPHEGSFWPWTHAYCGDIDICGFKRPQSYYRDVLWKDSSLVYLFVHPPQPSFRVNRNKAEWSKWNWDDVSGSWDWKGFEGRELTVDVYSSCQSVELFLNGRSLGKSNTGRSNRYIASYKVKYEPGLLEAKGYEKGVVIKTSALKTAGRPSAIRLAPDRNVLHATGEDLSFITVEVTDSTGLRNTGAGNLVKFSITGSGKIIAVGSSYPMGNESFTKPYRKVYQGRCLVIVKSDKTRGNIILKAEGDGLKSSDVIIRNI
ncbi:MAG TPA: glycoside hydrolase family 2 TIM barrel-domain containing protein [Bacteroidales bacterium]|nr:glycoside hydrolase family 2 TIM barrel-domain containing protein [Bacteroidales bacterium]